MTPEELDSLFWDLHQQAKSAGNGSEQRQYDALVELLSQHDRRTVKQLENIQHRYKDSYQGDDYINLHVSRGGPISGGDDTFFMDFGHWLVAQGKELYEAFQKEGNAAIERYIDNGGYTIKNYGFECFGYAFQKPLNVTYHAENNLQYEIEYDGEFIVWLKTPTRFGYALKPCRFKSMEQARVFCDSQPVD